MGNTKSKQKPLDPETAKKQIKRKRKIEEEATDKVAESVRRLDKDVNKLTAGSKLHSAEKVDGQKDKKKMGRFARFKKWWAGRSFMGKVVIATAIFSLASACVVGIFLGWLTGYDGRFIKSKVEGRVTNESGKGIEGVVIYIEDDEKAKTDEKGYYEIGGLANGRMDFRLEKNGFETLEENVRIGRYSTEKDFEMIELEKGWFSGELDMSAGFDPELIEIKFNDSSVSLLEDYTFLTEDEYIGLYSFSIRSPEFVDIVIDELLLEPGETVIEDIELTPAADIRANVVDWITEQPVDNYKVEGLEDSQFSIIDSQLVIKDFTDLDQIFRLKVTKEGYLDQIKEQKVVMGENDFGTIVLYRDIGLVYEGIVGGKSQILSIDHNGENKRHLVQAGTDNWSPLRDSSGNILFVSERTGIPLVYSTSDKGGEIQVTTNIDGLVSTSVNLKAGKLANSYFDDDLGQFVLEFGDLSGSNRNQIYQSDVDFSRVWISENGGSVFFLIGNKLYRYGTIYGDVRALSEKCLSVLAIDESGDALVTKETNGNFYLEPNKGWHKKFPNFNAKRGLIQYGKVYLASDSELAVFETNGTKIKTFKTKGVIYNMWKADGLLYFRDGEGVKVVTFSNFGSPKKIT